MTDGERRLCEYKFETSCHFFECLFRAFECADTENFARLRIGFPEEGEAFYKFRNEEDYWDILQIEFFTQVHNTHYQII